ncbi:putative membrane protein [Undibacterium sp. GrIS 1.2]|uniref:DUF1624 domain-containing protein n=1 Tax=Undibacterium sp. GrIS 1.2 TaxID=3143933 RepID=UPI00339490C0
MKTSNRLLAIDVLRGLVIVLMALDHVRDFFAPTPFNPLDLTLTSPGWFWTRWITHLCAPTFVLLAGISAFLRSQHQDKWNMARYLLSRGALLIFLELTWINFSWQFSLDSLFLQVIWALGVAMMVMAALQCLPRPVILLVAAALLLPHNLLDSLHRPDATAMFKLWHQGGWIPLGDQFGIFVLYPLMPWVGLMAVGYCLGPLLLQPPARRQQTLLLISALLMLSFIALRSGNWYGDPDPWSPQAGGWLMSLMSFVDIHKYPPSLLYLCVTLSISLALLALMDKYVKQEVPLLSLFGSHPLFFYCVHVMLIHVLGAIMMQLLFDQQINFDDRRLGVPSTYHPSLVRCYLAWVFIMTLMYGITHRWVAYLKESGRIPY